MSQELEQWLLEERREGFKEGFKKGLKKGYEDEFKKGLKKGEDRVATLWKRMKADGRLQDFYDALDDKTLREKLYKEYGIE
ncbi:hypothetical protein [Megasphaera sp.]|uniref:hypothetical protein n=1 Tax=Megasphaera sp. TaxID=2023260 RepID=UPI003F80DF98